jgi:uncharacterized protein
MISTQAKVRELSLSFPCGRERSRLYGILHQPEQPSSLGVLIVTGRPALRAGRHRLFVLLARAWAEAGFAVMRFDFRGTGDSEGEMGTLDDTSEDIASAVDAFMANTPGLQKVVLWGLCGGASDSILYAPRDSRIVGVALVNPWSYDGRLRRLVALRRYGGMVVEKVRRWAQPADGDRREGSSAAGDGAAGGFDDSKTSAARTNSAVDRAYASYRVPNLSGRLAEGLEAFAGKILLILSGQDTGSLAFKHAASISLRWRKLLSAARVTSRELPEANHSLRRAEWRSQAAAWTMEWLREFGD